MSERTACPVCAGTGLIRVRPRPLTRVQRRVLDIVETEIRQTGVAPTLAEIGAQLGGRCFATVHEHLRELESRGYILREFQKRRGIRLMMPQEEAQ